MSMNAINAYTSVMPQNGVSKNEKVKVKETADKTAEAKATDSRAASTNSDGVVFEPSKEGLDLAKKSAGLDRSELVKQLKADLDTQKQSLIDMVRQAIGQQVSYGVAVNASEDDVWKLLSSGEFTVTEAAREKAKELISEDGYWGVKQTSDRIVEFAKAISGGDVTKADKLFEAFKKGYSEATKSWGKALPDISKQTYDAVEKKFDEWKNSAKEAGTEG